MYSIHIIGSVDPLSWKWVSSLFEVGQPRLIEQAGPGGLMPFAHTMPPTLWPYDQAQNEAKQPRKGYGMSLRVGLAVRDLGESPCFRQT